MNEIENTTEAVKNTSELANNVYSDLRPIIQPVAKCIGNVLEFASCVTLPLQYWTGVAKANYAKRLEEYSKKLENVSEQDRCEVHPEIGVPIMQALPYTTNDDIAEMFTNLLASASISSMAGSAHPAFVEYIKQMSPDEAKIVQYLKNQNYIPYITMRANFEPPRQGFVTPVEKMVSIDRELTLVYPDNIKIDISNLLSLGVLADASTLHLADDSLYQKIINLKGLDALKARYENMREIKNVTYTKGYYEKTEIGKLFIKACCR